MVETDSLKEKSEESSSLQDAKTKNGEKDLGSGISEDDLCKTLNESNENLRISQQFAYIDQNGMCKTCEDASASNCSLTCLFCKSLFHAVCADANGDRKGNEVICVRSFYSSFTRTTSGLTGQKRPHNFLFACDVCMTQRELVEAEKSESKVDLIDRRVNELSQSFDEMKDLLNKVVAIKSPIQPANTPTQKTPALYSEIAQLQKPLERSVLILQSQSSDTKEVDTQKIENIIRDNSIHIDKKYENRNGELVFVCPTANDRETLNTEISQHLPEMKRHQPPQRLPTITVANISHQYSENELSEEILQAHPDIKSLHAHGETFLVLKVKKQSTNPKYHATIRVSNNIRKIIEGHRDRLYIGSYSCKVFNHLHVKRCNNCNCYGHYKEHCKAMQPTCGYCSKNHHSENCTEKTVAGFLPCCPNCRNGKFDNEKHSHTAFDRTCPSYKTEQELLKKTINYYNQKN